MPKRLEVRDANIPSLVYGTLEVPDAVHAGNILTFGEVSITAYNIVSVIPVVSADEVPAAGELSAEELIWHGYAKTEYHLALKFAGDPSDLAELPSFRVRREDK